MSLTQLQRQDVAHRAGLYEFYSSILTNELDTDRLSLFRTDPWASTLESLGILVPSRDQDPVESLAVDYCQIFIGPKQMVPPIQSVWATGQLESSVIDSMNEYLACVQTATQPSIKDHFGLQLEIMALILHSSIQSPEATAMAHSFFHDHIQWSIPMLDAASLKSQTDFYRGALRSAHDFIQLESETFKSP